MATARRRRAKPAVLSTKELDSAIDKAVALATKRNRLALGPTVHGGLIIGRQIRDPSVELGQAQAMAASITKTVQSSVSGPKLESGVAVIGPLGPIIIGFWATQALLRNL